MIAESEQAQMKARMEEVQKREAKANAKLVELAVRRYPQSSASTTETKTTAAKHCKKSPSRSASMASTSHRQHGKRGRSPTQHGRSSRKSRRTSHEQHGKRGSCPTQQLRTSKKPRSRSKDMPRASHESNGMSGSCPTHHGKESKKSRSRSKDSARASHRHHGNRGSCPTHRPAPTTGRVAEAPPSIWMVAGISRGRPRSRRMVGAAVGPMPRLANLQMEAGPPGTTARQATEEDHGVLPLQAASPRCPCPLQSGKQR